MEGGLWGEGVEVGRAWGEGAPWGRGCGEGAGDGLEGGAREVGGAVLEEGGVGPESAGGVEEVELEPGDGAPGGTEEIGRAHV